MKTRRERRLSCLVIAILTVIGWALFLAGGYGLAHLVSILGEHS